MLDDFEYLAAFANKEREKFIGNPVNAFLLLKKLHKDLEKFMDTLDSSKILKCSLY